MSIFKRIHKQITACICAVTMTVAILGHPMTARAVSPRGAIAQGVDVSKYNGNIDWKQVASAGMKFALIKAGSTNSGIDPNFDANIRGAQAVGIKTGVYIYSYATTPEEAIEEANLVLQWIAPYTVNFPVVFDIEDRCHKNLSTEQLIAIINSFCMTIDAAGYYPMVYSYKNLFDGKISICGWDRWVAHYNESCGTTNNVCIWQYTSRGRVPGVGGNVDLNYQYKDYSKIIIPEGFVARADGTIRFYRNWRMQTGWVDYNNCRYLLDGAGNLVRNWYSDEIGNYYFFDRADGHMLTGAHMIDDKHYYFNPEGIRMSGIIAREDGSYYYDPITGQLMTGWFMWEDETYFSDPSGRIVTGIYVIDGLQYYFDATGKLIRNQTFEIEGVIYQTTPEGVLAVAEVTLEQAG